MQRDDAGDDRAERLGNARVRVVGDMLLAFHVVVMNLGVEGLLDEARGSGELDEDAAIAYLVHSEALILKPIGDGRYIGCGGTIDLAELHGFEPMVEVGRIRIRLPGHECFQRGFLLRAALEEKNHAFHRKRCRNLATVKLRHAP